MKETYYNNSAIRMDMTQSYFNVTDFMEHVRREFIPSAVYTISDKIDRCETVEVDGTEYIAVTSACNAIADMYNERMASVHYAEDVAFNRDRAVKLLKCDVAQVSFDPASREWKQRRVRSAKCMRSATKASQVDDAMMAAIDERIADLIEDIEIEIAGLKETSGINALETKLADLKALQK